ncbi:MAG: AarF/UbiB family protein [Sulfolobaceae archaeon]|nr:AarF/UbiB family protein [Sulfolobaceae archaeon]
MFGETKRTLQIVIKLLPRFLKYRDIRNRIINKKPIDENEIREEARKLVKAIMDLGPTFIKLGQVLSVRPDIFPQEYLDELAKLQDEVTPAPFDQVKDVLYNDLKDLNIIKVEEVPIASASLGQVHIAYDRDGNMYAVKVKRPNIENIVEMDLKIIKRFLPTLRILFDSSILESLRVTIDEFHKTLIKEMDYEREASFLVKFREQLYSDFHRVKVPKLIKATKNVIVMEYLKGYKVTSEEAKKIVKPNVLAFRVFQLFMTMLLEKPYFHADPHPGNLAVDENGNIILYDYGMVGTLPEDTKKKLLLIYGAIVNRDSYTFVRILDELGAIQPEADREVLAEGIDLFLKEMTGVEVSEFQIRDYLKQANEVFYRFPLRLPSGLWLPLRMINVLEGTCTEIDPNFDFMRNLAEFLQNEGLLQQLYMEQIRDTANQLLTKFRAFLLRGNNIRRYERNGNNIRSTKIMGVVIILISIVLYLFQKDFTLSLLIALLGVVISFIQS